MANIPYEILTKKNELFLTWHGAFVENYVAASIMTSISNNLFYWKSEGKKAEVDFLIEIFNDIVPLEVKAGINTKSKSLKSYKEQFSPAKLLRTTLKNLRKDSEILNIPLYMVSELKKYL